MLLSANIFYYKNSYFTIACQYLKRFLKSHAGFDREQLQDYLNLFSFTMNPLHNKLEKIEKLLIIAIDNDKKLNFRDYFKQKWLK